MTAPTPGTTGLVDLRSDTVTRPGPGMRAAMAAAEVGDDVYAEDPTTAALEARVAAMLGHEAALLFPTGSMANMVAVRLLVPPGAELLADSLAHVVRAEMGGHAALGGITTRTWTGGRADGGDPHPALDPEAPLELMTPDAGPYLVSTAAVAVENTHNFRGGAVVPIEALRRVREGTAAAGVAVHLDGARLWNAHAATGVALDAWGACADTVSVCLSKGLGAPAGTVLASTAARIAEARVWRKRYGGGMRQTGVLAAAGLWALDHNVTRLADDHRRAAAIAGACAAAAPGCVDPASVATNIVVVRTGAVPAAEVAGRAAAAGVLVSALGPHTVRAVTHLDVDDAAAGRAADVLARVLADLPARPLRTS